MMNIATRQCTQRATEVRTSDTFQALAKEENTVGNVVCEIATREIGKGDNPPVPHM